MMPQSHISPYLPAVFAFFCMMVIAADGNKGKPVRDEMVLREWRFQYGIAIDRRPDETKWVEINIPHIWNNRDEDSGWYEANIEVPAAWAGSQIYLDAVGVECDAVVFVDGNRAAELRGPDARVDLTAQLKPGTALVLRLWVTRWWQGTENTRGKDLLRDAILKGVIRGGDEDKTRRVVHAGISCRVKLCAVPANAEITDVFVQPSVRRGELQVDVESLCRQQIPNAKIQAQVTELDGSALGLPSISADWPGQVAGSPTKQIIKLPWANPKLWEPGSPNLYYLQVRLLDGKGSIVDEYPTVRFGFREFWIEGRQMLLNGHPFRNRLIYNNVTPAVMDFYEGMGYNGLHFMPHPNCFRTTWGSFPIPNGAEQGVKDALGGQGIWDLADERGWVLYMLAPSVQFSHDLLLASEDARELYRRDLRMWFKRFDLKNHPSILAWSISMNTAGTHDPRDFGRRKETPTPWYANAEGLVKAMDPTRPVFHHQGATNGAFEFKNHYVNFMPLQEREDFPSWWSQHGDMPVGMAEMGTPFIASFFRYGNAPQFTEYGAIYFGDKAYARESDACTRACLDVVAGCKPARLADVNDDHRKALESCYFFTQKGMLVPVGEGSVFYDFMSLFARNTNRSFRSYGVNAGWWPWMMDVGFGVPPGYEWGKKPWWRYFDYCDELKVAYGSLKNRPDWANPIYDACRESMQPLLVYLGGRASDFSAKGHVYYTGGSCDKTIVAVWDGPGKKQFAVEWLLKNDGRTLAEGEERFDLEPGTIEKRPLAFTLPETDKALNLTLAMRAVDKAGGELAKDETSVNVLPKLNALSVGKRWGIYDPAGKTAAMLERMGLAARPVKVGDAMTGLDVLVVGGRALEAGGELPFKPSDIERGLKVLFLAQGMNNLEAMGFRVQDVVARQAFLRTAGHPAFSGLANEHFSNWQGEGALLPSTTDGMRQWQWAHVAHCGNRGSVASVIIETPHMGAYTPLADCEFDLAYSPLLQWRHGKGMALFCQFDIVDREGPTEPAAEHLLVNLAQYLDGGSQDTVPSQDKTIVLLAPDKDSELFIGQLGFAREKVPATGEGLSSNDIALVGRNALAADPSLIGKLKSFVSAGGTVVVLPQGEEAFADGKCGIAINCERKSLARLAPDSIGQDHLLAGMGPQLFHWRMFLDLIALHPQETQNAESLLGGLLLRVKENRGAWLFCQMDWTQLPQDSLNVRRTRWRMLQFYRQLFTNLGARTDEALAAKQFSGVKSFASPVLIKNWRVLTEVQKLSPQLDTEGRGTLLALGETLPVEKDKDAGQFSWRVVTDGKVDFGGNNARIGNIGYATTWLYSSRPREAEFSVRSDWWTMLMVNGKAYINNSSEPPSGLNPARAIVPLQAGWNKVEMKLGSGSGGFNFTCDVSDPGDLCVMALPEKPDDLPPVKDGLLPERHEYANIIYIEPLQITDDPYGWHAW